MISSDLCYNGYIKFDLWKNDKCSDGSKTMLNVNEFSKHYQVKKLNNKDVDDIYNLCLSNPLYYEYCPPMVSKESVLEDLVALPPGVTLNEKYYVGFYENGKMVAVMDLIDGYPKEKIAFIGFFMTDASVHNTGVGSAIISDVSTYFERMNYSAIRLAWVKGNPQAEHFWKKNGFSGILETSSTAAEHVILGEKMWR